MEKVKITQDQADAIEEINKLSFRTALTNRELFDAIKFGYEVDPEFKIGDWVTNKTTMDTIEIDAPNADFLNKNYSHGKHFRHATPEEIAKEKERRWWFKNDRDVWEIREDDILEYLNDLYIVDSFDSEKVYLKSGIERKTDYAEPFDFVKKHFKVVAFSDDRKDV